MATSRSVTGARQEEFKFKSILHEFRHGFQSLVYIDLEYIIMVSI